MASLSTVDSTGISQEVIDVMNEWRDWLSNDDDIRQDFELYLSRGTTGLVFLRKAVYVVQCLQALLPLEEIITGRKSRKTTVLRLRSDDDNDVLTDDAVGVFCDFLRNTSYLHTLRIRLCCNYYYPQLRDHFPQLQLRRLLESLHANPSLKELEISFSESRPHAADVLCIGNLLQHKKDWTYLCISGDYEVFPIAHIAPALRGLTHLRKLIFTTCELKDDDTRLLLESISDSRGLEHLDLSNNRITSAGLRTLTAQIPVAHGKLKMLDLNHNYALLDDEPSTQNFVDGILLSDEMNLMELDICSCGKYISTIIKACENDKTKLQVLSIIDSHLHLQPIRNQLVESLPKLKRVEELFCDQGLFHDDQGLFHVDNHPVMKALHENTSITSITWRVDYSNVQAATRCNLIATITNRNKFLKHAASLLAVQPLTGISIPTNSGIWYMAFAKMACSNVGANAIFTILQNRPTMVGFQMLRPTVAATSFVAVAGSLQNRPTMVQVVQLQRPTTVAATIVAAVAGEKQQDT